MQVELATVSCVKVLLSVMAVKNSYMCNFYQKIMQ
jgi:hypothetical protein